MSPAKPPGLPDPSDPLAARLEDLTRRLSSLEAVIIALSGGVDSALLLKMAVEALPGRVLAITAVSPSISRRDLEDAVRLATALGARHRIVETREFDNPRYTANELDRCYHCRREFFVALEQVKAQEGIPHVALGTNLDDLEDYRPGLVAAREAGAVFPLVEAGFDKQTVRAAARLLGIDVWDKPADACLSSRFPYFTPITEEAIARVAQCESFLKDLGFTQCRVRFHDELAKIEVPESEFERFSDTDLRRSIARRFQQAGFRFVALDLEGYRRGRLNPKVV